MPDSIRAWVMEPGSPGGGLNGETLGGLFSFGRDENSLCPAKSLFGQLGTGPGRLEIGSLFEG